QTRVAPDRKPVPGSSIMVTRLARLSLCVVFFLSINPIMAQIQGGSATGRDMLQHCGLADRIVSGQLSLAQAVPAAEDATIARMPPETAGCLEALLSVCDLEHDLSGLVRRTIQHAVGGARVGEFENLADRQVKRPAFDHRRDPVEP